MSVWPIHQLFIVDEKLSLKVPLYIIADDEVSFALEDEMVLDPAQIEELIQKVCSQKFHASIGVTDTFGVLRNYLVVMMERGAGAGDELEARRLGRIIAIASLFDSGVEYLRLQWSLIFDGTNNFLKRNVERNDRQSSENVDSAIVADAVKKALDTDLKIIIGTTEKTAKAAEIASLRALHFLELGQACTLLNTSDTTLRTKGFLNDLEMNECDPSKLNGRRKGKGLQAAWQFKQEEVERFAHFLHKRGYPLVSDPK